MQMHWKAWSIECLSELVRSTAFTTSFLQSVTLQSARRWTSVLKLVWSLNLSLHPACVVNVDFTESFLEATACVAYLLASFEVNCRRLGKDEVQTMHDWINRI
jgi:hypothetical protein